MFGKKRADKTTKSAKKNSRSNVEASNEMCGNKSSGNCSAKSTNSSKSKKA